MRDFWYYFTFFIGVIASGCSSSPIIIAPEYSSKHDDTVVCPEFLENHNIDFEISGAIPSNIPSTPRYDYAYTRVNIERPEVLLQEVATKLKNSCSANRTATEKFTKVFISKVSFSNGRVSQGTGHEEPVIHTELVVEIQNSENGALRKGTYSGEGRGRLYWLTASTDKIRRHYTEAAKKALYAALNSAIHALIK